MTHTPESKTLKEAAWLARKSQDQGGPTRYSSRSGSRENRSAAQSSDTTDWALKAKRYRPSR
jgi:hypothetical protein